MFFLQINNYGAVASEIFWGLWLFPFGRLVYRSGFIPGIFGVLLIINGVAYVADSCTFLLFPAFHDTISNFISPFFFGEVAITLWLLIKGVRTSYTARKPDHAPVA
jgi:hypothetical protein